MSIKGLVRAAAIFFTIFLLSGCRQLLNADIGSAVPAQAEEQYTKNIHYEVTDLDRKTDCSDIVEISINNLADNEISAENYTYRDGCLTINRGGCYFLMGRADNCRIVIKAFDDEIVHLILSDIELHAEAGPVLYGEQACKVIVTLPDDTENLIYDSAEYASDMEACIFCNCDLTINGSGSLNVYGYYHDAVRSKDRIKVIGTNLFIRAKNDGIRGNDGVVIEESSVEVESEGTGILAKNAQAYIAVQGGKLKVTSGRNAIYANGCVSLKECVRDLYSIKEAIKSNEVIDEGGTK